MTTMTEAGVVTGSTVICREVLKRQLHASPTNPRKEFPEPTIAEMAASVAQLGVIQPLIVRRWPEKDRIEEEAFEIVCGERRFRGASRVESLERIPVIVRVLSDTEVMEIQIIENLQREDVSAYDEAVGYAALLELRSPEGEVLYSVERISEKIGKTVSYVRNRLKMQRTPKVLLDALRKKEVGTRICEMVGRIPHAEDRDRCAAEILEHQHEDRAMTIEEAQEHIHEEYMVPLVSAPFDRKAPDLLKRAGSCEDCEFRTGKDPHLSEDLASGLVGDLGGGKKGGIDPQICQNPKCYRDKCEAHLTKVREMSPELVLNDAEAKSVFDDYGYVKHSSKLKKATDKPGYNDVGHWDSAKLKSWGEYAKRFEVPVKLAKNPKSGAVLELVDVSAVKAAEKQAAPDKPVFALKSAGTSSGSQVDYQAEERARKELEGEEVRIAFDRLSHHLVGQLGREELLTILEGAVDHPGIDVMIRWMALKPGSPKREGGVTSARAHKIEAIVNAVRGDEEHFDREGILILILMAQFSEGCSYNGVGSSRFKAFSSARGVDLKEVKAAAKLAVKERKKGKGGKAVAVGGEPGPVADEESAEEAHTKPQSHEGDEEANPYDDASLENLPADWVSDPQRGMNEMKLRKLIGDVGKCLPGTLIGSKWVMAKLDVGLLHAEKILTEAKRRGLIPEDGVIAGDAGKDWQAEKPLNRSMLAAAAEKKFGKVTLHKFPKKKPAGGAASEAWLASPDLAQNEKLLLKMSKTLKTWGPETVFDLAWVKAWVPGVREDGLAQVLLDEAAHRGMIAADQLKG